MQIQPEFFNKNMFTVAKMIYRKEGFQGFFRGVIPPLWGSTVYRGVMMSGYEFCYSYLEKECSPGHLLNRDMFFGLRLLVPTSAVFAAVIRGVIESKSIIIIF
jgi:hypothetical protein